MADEDVNKGSKAVIRSDSSVAFLTDKATAKDDGKDSQSSDGCGDKSSDDGNTSESAKSDDFVKCEIPPVTESRLADVMRAIRENHYTPKNDALSNASFILLGECTSLLKKDYEIRIIRNNAGILSQNYPQEILIPVKKCSDKSTKQMEFKEEEYLKLVTPTIRGRSRSRFIVPVILIDNKFICRCGTVGNLLSSLYETATNIPASEQVNLEFAEDSILQSTWRKLYNFVSSTANAAIALSTAVCILTSGGMPAFKIDDAVLMRYLKVEHICDLMVEGEKRAIKQTLPVSSSEKMDRKAYEDFKIEQMPFPGCEFFELYHNAGRNAKGLIFNWEAPDVDSEFKLTEDPHLSFPGIEWEKYKEWDMIQLTKNYMKVLLTHLARDPGSLIVHCISGWDRTPLFISLLRVSLWADGVVHGSLNTLEMAYFTLGYDWYLFGHNFPTRFRKHEEVMHFCLNFMQHLASDDFSITRIFRELPKQKDDRRFPPFKPGERTGKMTEISSLLLRMYDDVILGKSVEKMEISPEEADTT